jgi:hypothetical protein
MNKSNTQSAAAQPQPSEPLVLPDIMPGNHSGFPSTDRDTSRSMDDKNPKSAAERARESRQRCALAGEPQPSAFDRTLRATMLREYQAGNFNLDLNDLIASCIEQLVEQGCTRSGCRTALDSLFERAAP